MLVPAVPAAPPLAVLVLAWDEATPAVRALVEATQASKPVVDSILVLVPQAAAPAYLSAEEYLPVPLLAPAPQPAPTTFAPEPALPLVAELAPLASTNLASKKAVSQLPVDECFTLATTPVAAASAPLAWTTVRILRLGSFSLPQLAQRAGQPLPAPAWLGPATAPATPYLGTSGPPSQPEPAITNSQSDFYLATSATPELPPHPLESPALAATQPLPAAETGLVAEKAPIYDAIAQAPDPEADMPAIAADEPAAAEASASAWDETTPLAVGTATPSLAVQAGWPEALAALRRPASLPKPPVAAPELMPADATALAPLVHPALRPAATHYPAPDLNFQIIQYARFAVPVALAEPPFAVVYAPAWPTWLAAQELRQRTGRPLVLHVSTLAAAAEESVETATGWIAELQRQALRRADLILAETPALAQRLRHDLGLPASAVQIVPAADTAAVAQALHAVQL